MLGEYSQRPHYHIIRTVAYNYDKYPSLAYYDTRNFTNFFPKDPQQCIEAMYVNNLDDFKDVSSKWNPTSQQSFIDWLWDVSSVEVTVKNELEEDINIEVKYSCKNKQEEKRQCKKGESITMKLCVNSLVKILNMKNKFLNGKYVDLVKNEISIRKKKSKSFLNWNKKASEEVEFLEYYKKTKLQHFSSLQIKKLSLITKLKNFTKNGYVKRKCPENLFNKLQTYYLENKDNFIKEFKDVGVRTVVNMDERNANFIRMRYEDRHALSVAVKPYLEEFCNCELSMRSVYGIRIYGRGNILHMHTDEPSTHVISVILQVHQELDEGQDWPLQVRDFIKGYVNISMVPGDMVIYESAKLIHGRPTLLRGKSYANIFLHFQPKSAWNVDFDESNLRYTIDNELFRYWPLVSSSEYIGSKDEL